MKVGVKVGVIVGVKVGEKVGVKVGVGEGVKVRVGAAAVCVLARLAESCVSVAAISSADGPHALSNTSRTIPTIPGL